MYADASLCNPQDDDLHSSFRSQSRSRRVWTMAGIISTPLSLFSPPRNQTTPSSLAATTRVRSIATEVRKLSPPVNFGRAMTSICVAESQISFLFSPQRLPSSVRHPLLFSYLLPLPFQHVHHLVPCRPFARCLVGVSHRSFLPLSRPELSSRPSSPRRPSSSLRRAFPPPASRSSPPTSSPPTTPEWTSASRPALLSSFSPSLRTPRTRR